MRALKKNTIRSLLLITVILPVSLMAAENGPSYLVNRDIYYGDDAGAANRELQSLDIYWQDDKSRRPVIIYVHGGGWAFGNKSDVNNKPDFFVPNGIAFISMNYRLRWDYNLYDQAQDVVSVVRWVHDNAGSYGLDPARVILMGYASGGHLASLVATDSRYLRGEDLSLSDIRSVVAIDTPSFDIPRLMDDLGSVTEKRQHRLIFGDDRKVWIAASPITHVGPNKHIPAFALLYNADDQTGTAETKVFASRLNDAGVDTIMIPGNQNTSETIDKELGKDGDVPTRALMAFIRAKI